MVIKPNQILSKVETRLEDYLRLVRSISIEESDNLIINSAEFRNNNAIDNVITNLKITPGPAIYMLSCEDNFQRENLISNFKLWRDNENSKGARKINIARFNHVNGSVLYLGSSVRDIRTRISQHLGKCHDQTYSLKLSKWDKNLNYDVRIQTFNILSSNTNLLRKFIEIIEQEFWEQTQPVFGKQSGL